MIDEAHALNIDAVNDYLKSELPDAGTLLSAEKLVGGQSNPTFLLQTTLRKLVLRRKPPGSLLKSAHAVDREYRVMKTLQSSGVPVPEMLCLCDDDSIIGSMFVVMEYVDGRCWQDQTLPAESNETRQAVYDEMNRVLAALHDVNVSSLGLDDFGPSSDYFKRQLSRWTSQYRACETDVIPDLEGVIGWLQENLPSNCCETALVHGDYRLDNLIFHKQQPQAIALIDWELSTLGDPVADLAYQCMMWRLPPGDLTRGLAGVDRKSLCIPEEEEYLGRYCERRGLDGINNWIYALTFCFFRLAAILQGVKKRAINGNASSKRALQLASYVEPIASLASEVIAKNPGTGEFH